MLSIVLTAPEPNTKNAPCTVPDPVNVNDRAALKALDPPEALAHTLRTKKATYWSRSRNKLWVKGEESGNVQVVKEIFTDCDQDVILIKVDQTGSGGAACHNGYKSCFYRKVAEPADAAAPKLAFAAQRLFDPATVYKKKV